MLEEPSNPTTGRPGANKTVLRVAWFVIGAGVLVAMSAAVAGGMNPTANVLPIRDLAGAVMLVGLVIVLAAYRAPWLQSIMDKSERAATASRPRGRQDLMLALVIVFAILLSLAFLITALLTLTGGVISGHALLVLRTMMPVVVLSLLVYGRGYLRTFCIGAIIPAGLQALSAFNLLMLVLQPALWQQAGWSARLGSFDSFIVSGMLAGAAGVVAMVVRFLVEHLQGSERPP